LCIFLACSFESYATNLRDAIDTAQANNRNIKLEQIRLNSVKTEKTKAISEFLPNVSANAGYGQRNSYYQGQTYDRSTKQKTEEIKLEQPIFEGLHSVSKYREANYKIKSGSAKTSDKIQEISQQSIFLNISVPIFQKGIEYANVSKAGYDRDAAKEEFEITKDNVTKEVNQALEEYRFFSEMNKTNKKLFELAQNRAEIFTKRSESKVEDPVETIRVKIEANDRKMNYINSQMDLVITHYKIKYFLGEI